MKLYVFRNGPMTMPSIALCNKTGAPFDMTKYMEYMQDVVVAPIPSYLIETSEGYVMVDTGKSVHSVADEVPEDQILLNYMKEIGVAPEDVKYVIETHLHVDHSGYLKHFKNAEIIVHTDELQKMRNAYAAGMDDPSHIYADMNDWFTSDLNWKPVEGVHEVMDIVPGVKVLVLGVGHSAGMLAVLVELDNYGKVLIASDSIYCKDNIEPEIALPGICEHPEEYIANINYLLTYAKENDAQIWFGHDPEQFATLTVWPAGYYE